MATNKFNFVQNKNSNSKIIKNENHYFTVNTKFIPGQNVYLILNNCITKVTILSIHFTFSESLSTSTCCYKLYGPSNSYYREQDLYESVSDIPINDESKSSTTLEERVEDLPF